MNVPLAGGTEGAVSTVSESMNVAVLVVDVTEVAVAVVMVVNVVLDNVVLVAVVVVLVAISMLNVAVAKRAGTDESPTGNAYMYMRGDVTPHTSVKPSAESCTTIVPLRDGSMALKLPPMVTVPPVESDVARRNARS